MSSLNSFENKPITNLFEKYGGFDFFHKIIYELYLDLFDHPEISYHFIGVNIHELSLRQAEYLCDAIGSPPIYKGRPLRPVHAQLKVSEYEFNLVATRFEQIFLKNGLEKNEVKRIMEFILSKKKEIVTVKISRIDKIMNAFYEIFKI